MRTILLILIPFLLGFTITEIHYDPAGSDNGLEYVEVQHDIGENLDNFTFEDATSSDVLHTITLVNGTISLLVEQNFNAIVNVSVYTAGTTLGNGLNNDQDTIRIKNLAGEIVAEISYNSSLGGSNGKSLCNNNGTLRECNATPGWIPAEIIEINNSMPVPQPNITLPAPLPDTTNQTLPIPIAYTLKITEVMANPKGNDRSSMPEGEWIELYNFGIIPLSLEGLTITDEKNNYVKLGQSNFISFSTIQPGAYVAAYLNGWSILNNNGDTVKLLHNTTILDQMSYGPIEEGYTLSLVQGVWKRTKPSPGRENVLDDYSEAAEEPEQFLHISGVPSDVALGTSFVVAIDAYRNTKRQANFRIVLDKVTSAITFSVRGDAKNISLQVPIALPGCLKKNISETTLRVEGVGLKEEKQVRVTGPACTTTKRETATQVSVGEKPRYPITTPDSVSQPEKQKNLNQDREVVYRSSGMKAKELAIYIFSIFLIALCIYLLARKHE